MNKLNIYLPLEFVPFRESGNATATLKTQSTDNVRGKVESWHFKNVQGISIKITEKKSYSV